MPTIIDGYNLLHVSHIFGRGRDAGSLERSRLALLDFLVSALGPDEASQTSIVFDAKDAPPGLPRQERYFGLTVHYASQFEDADAMIEELIRSHDSPRTLTVVSGDHRIQRAARRRKAVAIDSDLWFNELSSRSREKRPDGKPEIRQTDQEIQNWVDEFGDAESIITGSDGVFPAGDPSRNQTAHTPDTQIDADVWNPFPPGYGEDLLEDDDFLQE
jgi:predicted RNA-binding protein with PIN domain